MYFYWNANTFSHNAEAIMQWQTCLLYWMKKNLTGWNRIVKDNLRSSILVHIYSKDPTIITNQLLVITDLYVYLFKNIVSMILRYKMYASFVCFTYCFTVKRIIGNGTEQQQLQGVYQILDTETYLSRSEDKLGTLEVLSITHLFHLFYTPWINNLF